MPDRPAETVRYCRARRSRSGPGGDRLAARHRPGGLTLVVRHGPRRPAVPRRPRRRRLLAVTGIGLLSVISSLALVAGATPAESRALIGCPARDSLAVAAGGHTLRVRPEQPRGGTVLIHLCADPAAGPVTRWDVRTGGGEPTRLPVQAVSHQHALTATTTATGRAARLRVEVESASGERRRFTLTVPLPGRPGAGEP